jgi:hypothetical protein
MIKMAEELKAKALEKPVVKPEPVKVVEEVVEEKPAKKKKKEESED